MKNKAVESERPELNYFVFVPEVGIKLDSCYVF